ncbi:MAG: MarC family protein [Hyphomicrobiales bacterium]
MPIEWLINSFTTLFVIMDPIGLAPIFLALTMGMSNADRRAIAWRASLVSAVILILFALVGGTFLETLGISLPAFRIAGGLLLFWTAFEMIFEKRVERKTNAAERTVSKSDIQNLAVFPLAIPLMAGPGAISATVLIASGQSGWIGLGYLIGLILVIVAICYVVFLASTGIDRFLGDMGRTLLSRLLGVILSALAIQFIADGVIAIAGAV